MNNYLHRQYQREEGLGTKPIIYDIPYLLDRRIAQALTGTSTGRRSATIEDRI